MAAPVKQYLSESLVRPPCVFLRFGVGILHSMEKATQLVHGTPRLAASHRTCTRVNHDAMRRSWQRKESSPFSHGRSIRRFEGPVSSDPRVPRCRGTLQRNKQKNTKGRSYLTCSRRALPVTNIIYQRKRPSRLRMATDLLKLGWPGVWLLGAALLPCGACPLIRLL
jgi:hypothetical protein